MKKKICYHEEDKKKMLVCLFVTVFVTIALLTPTGGSSFNDLNSDFLYLKSVDSSGDILTRSDIAALQQQGEKEGWTFSVGENAATKRPLHELCGTIIPDNWEETTSFDDTPMDLGGLPLSFDWRDYNGVTPIRDQDGCGSCWAFSAIGAVECAIKLAYHIDVDLSEQWLVSQCVGAGDCGGGWSGPALDYMMYDGQQDPCGGNGAVLEEDFPYTASNMPCDCPYPHVYWIDSWTSLGGYSTTVDEIKQAIIEHGPVSTSVYADYPFMAYEEGVFNACNNNPGSNHAVVLVGWDDQFYWDGEYYGVWIMRNSWGTNWGMDGYMYIKYGCSNIGYDTCYVEYAVHDCNNNDIPDDQEIAMGLVRDCNGNGRPDECDIAYGASTDGDSNSIPDECEACQIQKIYPSENGQKDDYFGKDVAIDDTWILIGMSQDDEHGNESGSAFLYSVNDEYDVTYEQKIHASDGAAGDTFGFSVALDNTIAIIGAPQDDESGVNAGAAYVFSYDGSSWVEEQKLVASDTEAGDFFGVSVALYDTTAVIGASYHDDLGAAYVFQYDGNQWIEQQQLLASDGAEDDAFGFNLDIYDETILIGAMWHDAIHQNAGAAYLYSYDGSTWVEEQKLQASDTDEYDFFGCSVALSDTTAVIGASHNDDLGSKSGSAYVFQYNGDQWNEEQKLLPTDGRTFDMFGESVAIDNTTILVGMSCDDDNGGSSGSVYVFRYDGATWFQDAKLVPLDGAELDRFGYSVAVCNDIALVGAYSDDDNGENAGSVYLFGSTSWFCCPGDVTNDYTVDMDDIYFILGHWGEPGGVADVNNDGIVNIDDIFFVLGRWT